MNVVQPIRDKSIVEQILLYLKLTNERDYIFFGMGVHSGLRVSDLLKLRVRDVRDQLHVVYVPEKIKSRLKKRRKQKMFIIHPDIAEDLRRFIEGMDDDEYLFASRQRKTITGAVGEPISRVTAYRMLNKVARRFGVQQIGTHSLRKTWGYHLYMDDPTNLALLMKMFGHEDMTTTLLYLGLTQDAMDAAIRGLSYT
ncbi:tyrosine-type recombinase/integrase [Paenibacillus sp. HJGM_3]|uniref:tyrosine-type recombinase/integrase n=1 Tax=Paenibacillus sp. HJGM_3 TaxID=3379816 RepID=UPI00385F2434